MTALITDHAWRPTHVCGKDLADKAKQQRCGFMNCARPAADHARSVKPHPPAVDWSLWRKCPACGAANGEPCVSLLAVNSQVGATATSSPRPHGGRQPRTGGAR